MKFIVEVHNPGSGSVKPIDVYECPDATEAFGTAMYFGQHGKAVLVKEVEGANDQVPAIPQESPGGA